MVEHNLSVVSTLSDHITVLARGEVLAEGDYAAVSRNPEVMEAYLGAARMAERAAHWLAAGVAASTRGTANRTSCTASTSTCARRSGHAAGPQRRRQDDDAEVDHGRGLRGARARSLRRRRDDRAGAPTASRGSASRSVPEERGIFASLDVEENLMLPPRGRDGRPRPATDLRAVSQPARSACAARARSCRAASSRCSRSGAYCAPVRTCCCSTSPPKGWRR